MLCLIDSITIVYTNNDSYYDNELNPTPYVCVVPRSAVILSAQLCYYGI